MTREEGFQVRRGGIRLWEEEEEDEKNVKI